MRALPGLRSQSSPRPAAATMLKSTRALRDAELVLCGQGHAVTLLEHQATRPSLNITAHSTQPGAAGPEPSTWMRA